MKNKFKLLILFFKIIKIKINRKDKNIDSDQKDE